MPNAIMPKSSLPPHAAMLPDALADALGRVVAGVQSEWRRDLERITAESRAAIAEARADLSDLRRSLDDERRAHADALRALMATVKDGAPGADGSPGAPGSPGPEGKPGKMPIAKAWTPGVHYEGDVCTHRGSTYQALCDTANEPGGDDWSCLAAAGRSLNVRGTYNAEGNYKAFDIVALNGGSFVALKDAPGACPGDGWQLIASQGKRGPEGKPGAPGKAGAPGAPGEPGVSVVGWIPDAAKYLAIPVMSDGSRGDPLALRGLFENFLAETER